MPDGWMKLWNNHIAIILNEYLCGHEMRAAILDEFKGKNKGE